MSTFHLVEMGPVRHSGHLEKTVKFSPKCGWDICTKSSSKFFVFAVWIVMKGEVHPITCEDQEGECRFDVILTVHHR